jgi:predicted transglutaminase-like cysteine proteinase
MRQSLFGPGSARLRSKILFGFVVLATALGAAGAQAQTIRLPSPTVLLTTGGAAKPTMGWKRYCEVRPTDCTVDVSEPATVALTAKAWQTLQRINRKVNGIIEPMSDSDHWGVEDRWDLAEDGAGDCEDYQLLKRKLLVEAGFPRRALLMTVVIDEERQGHAVMMVRTDRGDFILDNKRNAILPWSQTGYTYVKREGSGAGSEWASLGGATSSPVATAGR